ncbi:hypothetical protein MBM_01860 [Drepanopeziza brunnea f. sp. 'multigermtubi' MB_m1]|uniref:Uncharacterized protein n=1 Tax=Marssonina brunnea f. sp. multigermtubi (strain MB_m1) TaxID=1072389 RepID=K1XGF9_MARBU|nr:uncharacterized protein MBM_01860 [Drepanopeziza brunnea f. sp. 'multigermtubi' MB_m1]EKD19908.1 hypothetical protein MBM_01860 [Drepanopeziza brunnea f. sp. 'multigermtubi' MB_m1]
MIRVQPGEKGEKKKRGERDKQERKAQDEKDRKEGLSVAEPEDTARRVTNCNISTELENALILRLNDGSLKDVDSYNSESSLLQRPASIRLIIQDIDAATSIVLRIQDEDQDVPTYQFGEEGYMLDSDEGIELAQGLLNSRPRRQRGLKLTGHTLHVTGA